MKAQSSDPDNIVILDGGFSTQLAKYVGPFIDGDPLWTARFNKTRKQDVVRAHLDFLRVGADVIKTNTYQASIEGHMKYLGMSKEESFDLIKETVQLAQRARSLYEAENPNSDRRKCIMGSVGPYGAHLHDDSEYSGSYADKITKQELEDWHRPRIEALIQGGVDGLAIETIPCQLEGEVLVDMVARDYPGVKFWVSFQCRDDSRLAHGELFRDAATSCWTRAFKVSANNSSGCLLMAVGVNCVRPKHAVALCRSLNDGVAEPPGRRIPLVVYPNSGETYTQAAGWSDKDHCAPVQEFVGSWLDSGARYVGGCCRTDAEDVRKIRKAVSAWCNYNNRNNKTGNQ